MMSRLISLIVVVLGIAVSKIATVAFDIVYEYWLLTAILVAVPLIVLEIRLIDRLPGDLKQYIQMDGTPFPFFTLGVATGIVLIGRDVL